jgi:hypothetical protein
MDVVLCFCLSTQTLIDRLRSCGPVPNVAHKALATKVVIARLQDAPIERAAEVPSAVQVAVRTDVRLRGAYVRSGRRSGWGCGGRPPRSGRLNRCSRRRRWLSAAGPSSRPPRRSCIQAPSLGLWRESAVNARQCGRHPSSDQATNAWRNSACGLYIRTTSSTSSQMASKSFIKKTAVISASSACRSVCRNFRPLRLPSAVIPASSACRRSAVIPPPPPAVCRAFHPPAASPPPPPRSPPTGYPRRFAARGPSLPPRPDIVDTRTLHGPHLNPTPSSRTRTQRGCFFGVGFPRRAAVPG